MLDREGFDSWAVQYDKSVAECDEKGDYPFAGYAKALSEIEKRVLADGPCDVLDVGFGTGVLTKRLYDAGCRIWGQDYSSTMIRIAQEKMPGAVLCAGDLSLSLASPVLGQRYDAVVATYALHHFALQEKCVLLRRLQLCMKPGAKIYIADVAFETAADQAACRARFAKEWDEEEEYIVYDELKPYFPGLSCEKISECCCLFTLEA